MTSNSWPIRSCVRLYSSQSQNSSLPVPVARPILLSGVLIAVHPQMVLDDTTGLATWMHPPNAQLFQIGEYIDVQLQITSITNSTNIYGNYISATKLTDPNFETFKALELIRAQQAIAKYGITQNTASSPAIIEAPLQQVAQQIDAPVINSQGSMYYNDSYV